MSVFAITNHLPLTVPPSENGSTLQYAVAELTRLLKCGGMETEIRQDPSLSCEFHLGSVPPMDRSGIQFDGFAITVCETGIGMTAQNEKGVLNGVYELAERLGFRFLTPMEDGELVPESFAALPVGTECCNPRFPHRGIFIQPVKSEVSADDRSRFFAKLKYNAVCYHGDPPSSDELCKMLGLRKEIGGHGFPNLLSRDKFASHPEYFRMFQPDDLGGKRQPDSNMCVTNPEVREIVVSRFRERLREQPGLYARHAWADDLPAGGWCWCPSCRSYSPEEQNMLAMKLLCRAADAENLPQRIPVIAYHDTLCPGAQVPVEPRMFLLWAPRERCYKHAINDPSCERNVAHWNGLMAWREKFKGIDDSHTFEYYLDQLLFNGFHPFTPETISGDMDAYEQAGIQSHMTLQCVPCDIIPDLNQQYFARAHWHRSLNRESFLVWLTDDAAFRKFLQIRAAVFQESLAMCGHDMKIYMDFRYLPESNNEFSRKMIQVYRSASEMLSAGGKEFAAHLPSGSWHKFAEQMVRQAEFEAAELMSMHWQQLAMSKFAEAQMNNSAESASAGCEALKKNLESIAEAERKCIDSGYPEEWWHLKNRIPVERREANAKLEKYSRFKTL